MEEKRRKSFLLYLDRLDVLDEMSDADAGLLFKAIRNYLLTGESPTKGTLVSIAFAGLKSALDDDSEKYRLICQKRAEAGRRGGRPRRQNKAKKANESKCFSDVEEKANESKCFFEKAKKADTNTDTNNDTEITTPFSRSNRATAGSELPISQTENILLSDYFVAQLKETYPHVDVERTLREIRLKLIATGYPCDSEVSLSRYVVSWFRNLSIADEKRKAEEQTTRPCTATEAEGLNEKLKSISADDI